MTAESIEEAGSDDGREAAYRAYYADVGDGCGCAELWEYLSERRREA